jgi:hypothetical protein
VQKVAWVKENFINRFKIAAPKLGLPRSGVQHYCEHLVRASLPFTT